MSNNYVNFSNQKPWYEDLCEYYKVTPEQAFELGNRRPNRKPSLPASETTHAVTDMTFEDIWALQERNTIEDVFKFYKDQGAWASFRQVVRHKDMKNFHLNLLSNTVRNNTAFCEYGCGVAPFAFSLLENVSPETELRVCISDVECEHFTFAQWRLKKLIKDRALKNVTLEAIAVKPGELPRYSSPLDTVFIFEVLEHVPSPVETFHNLMSQMNNNALFCENFIKHDHEEEHDPGPDLESAAHEREDYYQSLSNLFTLVGGQGIEEGPNETRVWRKNSL